MGPAHGAHSRPVATPSSTDVAKDERPLAVPVAPAVDAESRPPSATRGRVRRSEMDGNSSVMPNSASSTIAPQRPYWLAATAQPPPTAASVATTAKVSAMPSSSGRPLLTKGCSARANTKGSTGRMQGLRMVKTPPA